MRLTTVLLIAAFLQVQASGRAQSVTISGKALTFKQLFQAIEKQTGYSVFGNRDLLDASRTFSLSVWDMPLKGFLDSMLRDEPVHYRIDEKFIILSRKPVDYMQMAPPADITCTFVDETGAPVQGVTVRLKSKNGGVMTGTDGQCHMNALEDGAVLMISCVGYEPMEIKVSKIAGSSAYTATAVNKAQAHQLTVEPGQHISITAKLKVSIAQLDAVQVNKGYYAESKRLSTGSIVRVSGKDIERQPVTSLLQALQGRVPGMQITSISGAPAAAPKIRIRGESSFRPDGGAPLYVINGVMIESSPLFTQDMIYSNTGYDPLANIDPATVESIEVLKDADATAIYGSRGANGVILITTRQAKGADGLSFGARVYRGTGHIPLRMDMMNLEQYMDMRKEAFRNSNETPRDYDYDLNRWDSTRDVDWMKTMLGGSSEVTDIGITCSAGNGYTSFLFNGGYYKETSPILRRFGFYRAQGNLSVNHRSVNNRLNMGVNASYAFNNNSNLNTPPFLEAALMLPPNAPALFNADGSLNWDIMDFGSYQMPTRDNPYAEAERSRLARTGTLIANGHIQYEIARGLTLRTTIGYTNTSSNELVKSPSKAYPPTVSMYIKGNATFSLNERTSWTAEPQVSYSKKFGEHSLDVLVGSTLLQNSSRWHSVYAADYPSDLLLNSLRGAGSWSVNADEYQAYRYIAAFARIGYNWNQKYVLNLTGRRDGSSRFGLANRYGNFGAVSGAWIFTEEHFFKEHPSFISFGKLRSSYGVTGSDNIGDYKYYNLLNIDNPYQNIVTLSPESLFNPGYKWEENKKLEIGLELGLLRNRIMLEAAWYRNIASNQLIDYQLPFITGFESVHLNFPATIENTGWEFILRSINIQTEKFNWTTQANFSYNRNKLLSFPDLENSPYWNNYQIGQPLSIQKRWVWTGVDPQTGRHTFADYNGDGSYGVEDWRFTELLYAPYELGIENTFRYGPLNLSVLVHLRKQAAPGPYSYNPPGYAWGNQPAIVDKRWRKPGDHSDVAKVTRASDAYNDYNLIAYSTYNIIDASFIKFRTISLNYDLPAAWLARTKVKNVSVFFQGHNLITITRFIGMDPETGARSLPDLKKLAGGIQIKI